MSRDVCQICPLCAWRAGCTKRFSVGKDSSLHCPDFTEDLLLRKKSQSSETEKNDERVKEA